MRRRGLQRASFGLAVVAATLGCTTLSGIHDYEIDRTASMPDSDTGPLDASTIPPGSQVTDSASDAGADASSLRDAAPPAKRVFLTSATFNGAVGGLDGADSRCKEAATAANLGTGGWRAWLSTKTVNALSRLPYAGAYALVDGTLVANNATELASGALQHSISMDEYGTLAGADGGTTEVWTSTDEHGQAKADNVCTNWTSASYFDYGGTGTAMSLGADWTNGAARHCSDGAHLYCFEE